ncbi:hypothetical protein JB92DRAFT_3106442 [Gautieria morchelliformis]|nr:hypothetical protein JB92DRAFT_3106442 [Gautieria morchelliformis]
MPMTANTPFKRVSQFAQQARWNLITAHDAILEHQVTQVFHANKKHQDSDIYVVSDRVYLSTQNLALPKGRARKLVPRYIGPYHVLEAHKEASTVTLELPDDIKNWRVAPVFHTSLIRHYEANNNDLFPCCECHDPYISLTPMSLFLVSSFLLHLCLSLPNPSTTLPLRSPHSLFAPFSERPFAARIIRQQARCHDTFISHTQMPCSPISHSTSVFVPIALAVFGNRSSLFAPFTIAMPSKHDHRLWTDLAVIAGPITSSAQPSFDDVPMIRLS